jgi:DNA modification methylase
MKRQLIHGDSVKELKKFDDNSIDLLCTDPPYGYGFMGRDWDKVLPDIKIFEECFRVLKPGSMAFVMSAPRSDVQYRMAEMLEKVGFRIDYTPIYWAYASGFPKAMNISKMLDAKVKTGGGSPTNMRKARMGEDYEPTGQEDYRKGRMFGSVESDTLSSELCDEAKKLDGSYAGFQPKPAVEVVIVAMKPLDKKGYLEQAQDNQKGITWFDDCRIPFEEGYVESENQTMPDFRDVGKKSKEAIGIDKLSYGQVQNAKRKPYKTTNRKPRTEDSVFKTSGFNNEDNEKAEASPMGRFPANLLISDDVLNDGTITTSQKRSPKHNKDNPDQLLYTPKKAIYRDDNTYSDSGGYSRYYSLDAWWNKNIKSLPEPVQQTFPFMIVPKASRREKDNGLEFMEEKKSGAYVGRGGSQDDPNGMFKDRETKSRNIHPTVKPLTLMNYLVVLGSRKGDVVLEPFAGSGTTALACVGQERDYIAIEREEEYYEIAKARLEKVEEPIKLWEKFS